MSPPDINTRPQAKKNRRRTLWGTLRIDSSRERRWGVVSAARLHLGAHLDIEQLNLPMQMAAFDFQIFRRAGNIPVMFAQLPRNERAFSIRYPRGQGVLQQWQTPFEEIKIGSGRIIREGQDLAVLTIGHIGNYAVEVCDRLEKEGIHIGHYDMRFVKPLDEALLHRIFKNYSKVITVEDGCIAGGFGSAVLEFMADQGYHCDFKRLGIPDAVIEHGEQLELHDECGFGPKGIESSVRMMLEPVSRLA